MVGAVVIGRNLRKLLIPLITRFHKYREFAHLKYTAGTRTSKAVVSGEKSAATVLQSA
jgi:hypothetical protein